MASIFFVPGGGTPPALDGADVLAEVYPALGASNSADLVFWTAQDLLDWLNEALQKFARRVGVFVERDASTAVVSGTAGYSLPARHLSTLHVALDGAELRPASVKEIEALDADWPNTAGTVERYLEDVTGFGTITLYREPAASGTLAVVFHRYPAEVDEDADIPLPETLADYLTDAMLAEARGTEGDGAMSEVAQFCGEEMRLYEEIAASYWGMAQ